jgi:uncharacterized protein (TIGR03067 family)
VPAEVIRVVGRMLAKDPAARYQTPAEVAEALRPFTTAPPPRRGHRRLAAAAVLGIAAFVAGAVVYVKTDEGEFIIETTGDAIFAVNTKGVEIRDPVSGRKYRLRAGKHNVCSGNYEIQIAELPDGIEFTTTSFTLKRGGRVQVTARLREPPDQERLLGTWWGVRAVAAGQPVPEAVIRTFTPSVTVQKDRVIWRAGGPFEKLGIEGVYKLDPAKNPKTIDIIALGDVRKTMLGIYRLDPEKDEITMCLTLDPDRPDERPTEFATTPDRRQVLVVLRRGAAPPQPKGAAQGAEDRNRLVTAFGPGFKPITRDGVKESEGGWRIDARGERVVRLYEVRPPLEESVVVFKARMKSADLRGKAYLEMWCRMPGGGEFFTRGATDPLRGTSGWDDYEIPFVLQKEERPDLFKLNVHLEGAGTVWIKDVELWRAPLPPGMRLPSVLGFATGGKAAILKAFGPSDRPFAAEGVTADQKGWRIDAKENRTVVLFEVKDPGAEGALLTFRAQLKSADLRGVACLTMWCHFPGDPADRESFSEGLQMPVSGTTEWASYETSFRLEKGQKADRVRLGVDVEGKGTVWIRDAELLQAPLPGKP